MSEEPVFPEWCTSMVQVRDGVDAVDREIVALLAKRFQYMNAAARIKPDRDAVRDEWRKADVLGKVRDSAKREGAPVERIVALYDALIESSIAHEFERWDATRETT